MSIDRLDMLAPNALPTEAALAAWEGRDVVRGAAAFAGDASAFHRADAGAATARLLDLVRPAHAPVPPDQGQPDDRAHDAYFHVARVRPDDPCATFVRTAIATRAILLQEIGQSPVALAAPLLGLIDRALADLIACAVGGGVDQLPAVTAWGEPAGPLRVMSRWIRGHQVFATLTQGLILSFGAVGRAVRRGDHAEVRRWADLTVSLLRGSGASFVLTGDFSVEEYNAHVRPSMMPPAAPICLSGLMSVDHRVLVQTIRDLKPALRSLHEHDPARHARVHDELRTVYDRHIHVCARFVGDRPSLLTAGNTDKSGPALIGQFKALRLKPFDVPAHAVPIKSDVRGDQPRDATCPYHESIQQSPES